MPELPEVETTLNGIKPAILKQTVVAVKIREPRLRWPVPRTLNKILSGQTVKNVSRRGKYLIIQFDSGALLIHLGMSGNLRILPDNTAVKKHDHVDILFNNKRCLRYHDPRRFGCILWTQHNPLKHKLLASLGPEPLTREFNTNYLYKISRNRKVSIKQFIMNANIVVGVGNIYASEALFLSGINPARIASSISTKRYDKLVSSIKAVLIAAIKQGGTTLRDFVSGEGKPGYFKQKLKVYDRSGETCQKCKAKIKSIRQAQRATYYCPHCQT